jgi:hypothetical protein
MIRRASLGAPAGSRRSVCALVPDLGWGMAHAITPGQRPAGEPCQECGQEVVLESIEVTDPAPDTEPTEIRVCSNPVCVTNSPNRTMDDVP